MAEQTRGTAREPFVVKVGSRGQVVIPQPLRGQYQVEGGEHLLVLAASEFGLVMLSRVEDVARLQRWLQATETAAAEEDAP